jgi:glutaconate CoA-transferase subunit A
MTEDEFAAELSDGMTIGIGGWGSRRKPMALVRAIARSGVRDLTIVSYGGPDVGILCAMGQVRKLITGFVSLDSIPLEPHYRKAREAGALEVVELDEGMLQWGLQAQAMRLPFLPTRAGLGSDVMRINPFLKTVRSPYDDDEELVAMPALPLDLAIVHVHRADVRGNAQVLGPDPYFDELYCMAARRRFISVEQLVTTESLASGGAAQTLLLHRMMVDGIVETPGGAHFTSCEPDYPRDEVFQAEYAASARDDASWAAFRDRYVLAHSHAAYRRAVSDR